MTFKDFRKNALTRSAAVAVAVLAAGSLTACGGGDDAASSDVQDLIDRGNAQAQEKLKGSDALQAAKVKAEGFGYKDCMTAPADIGDTDTISLRCFGAGDDKLATITLFDKADRASGEEVAEAELAKMTDGAAAAGETDTLAREDIADQYRPLDGDDVAGFCQQSILDGDCGDVAEGLGLRIGMLDGALTEEEKQKKRDDEMAREAREYDEKQKREEEEKQKALQTYSGWNNLDEAREQLDAWDIHCRGEQAAKGKLAWCDLRSVLVSFGLSADDLEKKDVFKEVGRDDMRSVSDGDWEVMCAPGAEDKCDLIADKTGKSVKTGV